MRKVIAMPGEKHAYVVVPSKMAGKPWLFDRHPLVVRKCNFVCWRYYLPYGRRSVDRDICFSGEAKKTEY